MIEQLSSAHAPGEDAERAAKPSGAGRSQAASRRIWGMHAGGAGGGGGGGAGNWIRSVFLPSSYSPGGTGEAKGAGGRAGDGPSSSAVSGSSKTRDAADDAAGAGGGDTPARAPPRGEGGEPEGAASESKPGGGDPPGETSHAPAAAAAAAATDKDGSAQDGHKGGETPVLHASVANRLAPQVLRGLSISREACSIATHRHCLCRYGQHAPYTKNTDKGASGGVVRGGGAPGKSFSQRRTGGACREV